MGIKTTESLKGNSYQGTSINNSRRKFNQNVSKKKKKKKMLTMNEVTRNA